MAVPDPSRALEGGSRASGWPVGERCPSPLTPTAGAGTRSRQQARLPGVRGIPPGGYRPLRAAPTAGQRHRAPRLAVQPSRSGRRGDGPSTRVGRSGACAPPGPQRPTRPADAYPFERRRRLEDGRGGVRSELGMTTRNGDVRPRSQGSWAAPTSTVLAMCFAHTRENTSEPLRPSARSVSRISKVRRHSGTRCQRFCFVRGAG